MTTADVDEASADPSAETLGQYDDRILAAVKLAPPLGMTAKEVVQGVVGVKKAAEAYGTIWHALKTLSRRGLIQKDGRYYRLPKQAQED